MVLGFSKTECHIVFILVVNSDVITKTAFFWNYFCCASFYVCLWPSFILPPPPPIKERTLMHIKTYHWVTHLLGLSSLKKREITWAVLKWTNHRGHALLHYENVVTFPFSKEFYALLVLLGLKWICLCRKHQKKLKYLQTHLTCKHNNTVVTSVQQLHFVNLNTI